MTDRFIELVQIALGNRTSFSTSPTQDEWSELYVLANRHGIAGVLFDAIYTIPKEHAPSADITADWFTMVNKLKEDYYLRERQVEYVTRTFKKHGFNSIILKGMSISKYYPKPEKRHSSDIDVWIEGNKKDIVDYVCSVKKPHNILYHHCDFDVMKDTSIEVHFTPSFFANPFANRRFQKWAKTNGERLFPNCNSVNEGFNGTDMDFDIPYLLTHLFRHVMDEELELKPVIDYYFVLNSCTITKEKKQEYMKILHQFGIDDFAAGVMYILQTLCGMKEDKMICKPNRKYGEQLISEIFKPEKDKGCLELNQASGNHIKRFFKRQMNMARFLPLYPYEVLWTPYWTIKIFFLLRRNK